MIPRHKPREGLKTSRLPPLNKTEKETEVTHLITVSVNLGLNPIFIITTCK